MRILTYFPGMLLFTFIFYAVTITGMGLMYNYYGKSELVSDLVRVISCMSVYIISMMLLSIWLKLWASANSVSISQQCVSSCIINLGQSSED